MGSVLGCCTGCVDKPCLHEKCYKVQEWKRIQELKLWSDTHLPGKYAEATNKEIDVIFGKE